MTNYFLPKKNGFSPTFPILQGTREGCILSPLLFLIFFLDAMAALERVQLEDGIVLLGAMTPLAICFFADDVVLLACSLSDLQRLLNAFSAYCDRILVHKQIALDKTEAVLFSGQSQSCPFFIRDGALYKQRISQSCSFHQFKDLSRRATEKCVLLKNEPIVWSSFFSRLAG